MILGYARVSTNAQDLTAQVRALSAAGAVRVFKEVASGARSNRPQLEKLLRSIGPKDLVIVTHLDRLARSTRDLLLILDRISQQDAGFKSLAHPWADTTTAHGRLLLTVLGGFAEFERELIRARTGEGRARAIAQGVRMGRKPKMTRHQIREAIARKEKGEPVRDIALTYGVSYSTISRLTDARL
jgi:DNA invertase Pin-like site-specific DNA recombinase